MKILNAFKSIFSFDITRNEMPKFLALSGVMFCVLFNYTILRDIKDVIVIGSAGTEVIPYIKGIFVIVGTILFMTFYAILVRFIGERKAFYSITLFFLTFFAVFCFYLYPNADKIHPTQEGMNAFVAKYPFFKYVFYLIHERIFINWSYVLFYVFAELWGTACVSVLFWQLANEIVSFKLKQGDRFYPIFGIISNLGLIFSGGTIKYIVDKNAKNYSFINIDLTGDYIAKIISFREKFPGNKFLEQLISKLDVMNKVQVEKGLQKLIGKLQWSESLPELAILMIAVGLLMILFHRFALSISAVEIQSEANAADTLQALGQSDTHSSYDDKLKNEMEKSNHSISFFKILKKFFSISISGEEAGQSNKKRKKKMGIMQSIKLLFTSKYLLFLTGLVVCYGMSINMFEIVWKKQIELYFDGDSSRQAVFQATISERTGIFVILFILLTKNIFSKMTWFTRAMITPAVMSLTGMVFFGALLFKNTHYIGYLLEIFAILPVYVAVLFGGIQSVLTKGCKYSMFDPTKEVLYIPLGKEEKTNAKAAVDGIGGRLSKGMGSYVWMFLLRGQGKDITFFIPFVSVLIGLLMLIWFVSVKSLHVMYGKFAEDAAEKKVNLKAKEKLESESKNDDEDDTKN